MKEIPYPTEVTEENRNRIMALQGQGRSLASSVAQFIIEEGTALMPDPEGINSARAVLEMIAHKALALRFYSEASYELLAAEQYGLSHLSRVKNRIFIPIVKFGNKGDTSSRGNEVRAIIHQIESKQANYRLLKLKGPLGFIDTYTEQATAPYRNNPVGLERTLEAFERGKERFHQLYCAINSTSR